MTDPPVRTLVVGDDPASRSLLESVARDRRHLVEATGVDHAWEMYRKERHELVVLDSATNGGTGGAALCRRIKERKSSVPTMILVLSESWDMALLEEVLEAGADGVIGPAFSEGAVKTQLAVAERRIREARERDARGPILLDGVTGLASHPVLIDRVRESIRRASRDPEHIFAVLELDLDAFGPVVRRSGQRVADRVLAEVAERLRSCVRDTDLVARIHGDRFAILLDSLHDLSDPARVARRIHEAFEPPFRVNEDGFRLTTGIGIALSLTGYDEAGTILRDAHSALRLAKVARPGATRMFDPEMDAQARHRIKMEDRIRDALAEGLMELWYQPILSLSEGTIVGLEALARMRSPEGGLVHPDAFIPVAEESGLIEDIGWWTLEEASKQLREWQKRFPRDPALTVSVNVSAKQFSSAHVFEQIRDRIRNGGIEAGSIHLEITETAAMADTEITNRALQEIKKLEVRIHIDDFGTGYSSLSHLCRLPVDTLKIDQIFVDGMARSRDDFEVVRTILGLADALGLDVVAEGVETAEQLDLLRELGCDLVQGFYLHRPMPADRVAGLLDRKGRGRGRG